MSTTRVMFLNHSSVIIRFENEYLWCDPWFEKPAFGSWLPTFPLFSHPVYIASLEKKLSLLISHGHDDHCDDDLLQLLDNNTPVISSDFSSPSVKNRVKKLGFNQYHAASESGVQVGPFFVKSFRNEDISEDDAAYLIKTKDAVIIHCNDNWFPMSENHIAQIKKEIADVGEKNVLFMSQTNSASGFPLNYTSFSPQEKAEILKKKVHSMIAAGLNNAAKIGAPYFHSYAGYASVFVKGKDEYLSQSIFPTAHYIKTEMASQIPPGLEVLDFYPGDVFDFKRVQRSFYSGNYTDEALKKYSSKFYNLYGHVNKCDTYNLDAAPANKEMINAKLDFFLGKFDEFVKGKNAASDYYSSITGKTLKITVPDCDLAVSLKFGSGITTEKNFNKEIIVNSNLLLKVLNGEILFENLYTGYNAEFNRVPKDVYNKDIVMFIVMFSYVYRNRIIPSLRTSNHEI
ncbi:MAG TPA: MBL fold metallo-hydrolase [Bacteroidia bacterium]|jgi:hypothetical protein|nr:MBL fold metallo-hydrolase [Bacteroidia bacterium]